MRNLIVLAAVVAAAGIAGADVALPKILSDGMVLQADKEAVIWGTAEAGEEVTVEIAGQKKTATAKDGAWSLKLDPLAAGQTLEMKVTGKNALTVKNILTGEVWLASGQSNMRFPLSKATEGPADAAKCDDPQFRYYYVPTGKWVECSAKTAPAFSAIAFYFGQALRQARKAPVGIIENAVNGAVIQTFMSPEVLATLPEQLEQSTKNHEQAPSAHWKRLFEPILPYTIRGAGWYQGEGNRDFPASYAKLLPAMIADWRKRWGQGDFPFVIFQLANYGTRKPDMYEGKDCTMREAQAKAARDVPAAALVVNIDVGIDKDVHFPDKKPSGLRWALAARALAYGEKIESSGPVFQAAQFKDGKAVVSFTHVGAGLEFKGGPAKGLFLAGADKKFHHAQAVIEGETIVVSCPEVAAPVAVRYAWERNPECNLYNKDGLPAGPFRSDSWENYFTRDGS